MIDADVSLIVKYTNNLLSATKNNTQNLYMSDYQSNTVQINLVITLHQLRYGKHVAVLNSLL